MNDFSATTLVPGSLIGYRSFQIGGFTNVETDRRRVRSMGWDHDWRPGENVAHCGGERARYEKTRALPHTYTSSSGDFYSSSGNFVAIPNGSHHVAALECTCGFYAYHKGASEDSFKTHLQAADSGSPFQMGLVEGYGRVTVGSKGFRCEKARILCFIVSRTLQESPLPEVPLLYAVPALQQFPLGVPPG